MTEASCALVSKVVEAGGSWGDDERYEISARVYQDLDVREGKHMSVCVDEYTVEDGSVKFDG